MATKPGHIVTPEFASIVAELASTTFGTRASITEMPAAAIGRMARNILSKRLQGTAAMKTVDEKSKKSIRYIVTPITGQQASGPVVKNNLREIHRTLQSHVMRSSNEDGPKVLRLTPTEAALLKERYAGIVVEPDLQYRMAGGPLEPQLEPIAVPASSSRKVTVRLTDNNGDAIEGASVYLQPKAAVQRGFRTRTNTKGLAVVSVRNADKTFERVTVVPRARYWSKILTNVDATKEISVEVSPTKANGFDWGCLCCGADKRDPHRGKGVRVAVIDSGIAKHSGLNATKGRNFIADEPEDGWANDTNGHGTHCAGVIAALASQDVAWGYAPDCELAALRVFGGSDGGGHASDIGDAIQWAIDNECDIISMSLVHEEPVHYLRTKIEKAFDAGILIVAAAGNEGSDVRYPAKFRQAVGISAIGKAGTYPEDSIHRDAETPMRSADGQIYLASFSNRGVEIDFCAPGVAVTSTYPGEIHAVMDGTSMACPQIAGIAALALNKDPKLAAMKRGPERAAALLDRLRAISLDLGLGREAQGAGIPMVSRL